MRIHGLIQGVGRRIGENAIRIDGTEARWPKRTNVTGGESNDRKSDAQQDYRAERHQHRRSGQSRRRSGLDAELRSGGDDLPDRLQDLEGSSRSDETGAAFLFPDAGRKGQSRLRRARCGVARRHVPQCGAALDRVDEAVPGDHSVPGNLGRRARWRWSAVWRPAKSCAPASRCRWSTSSATRRFR